MDRSFKHTDTVHVYQSTRDGKLLDTFSQQPYTHAGRDNYMYKGVMYLGYTYPDNKDAAYILLDSKMFN